MKTNLNANSSLRCLVVDDNPQLLKITSLMLALTADVEICCCNSGPEALAAFTDARGEFDFVVTDFDMPGMNGRELCRHLHELAPELVVVLATGSECISDEEASRQGFFRLLHKPFPLESIRATMAALRAALAPKAEALLV